MKIGKPAVTSRTVVTIRMCHCWGSSIRPPPTTSKMLTRCLPAKVAWSRGKMGKSTSGDTVEQASPGHFGHCCNEKHVVREACGKQTSIGRTICESEKKCVMGKFRFEDYIHILGRHSLGLCTWVAELRLFYCVKQYNTM